MGKCAKIVIERMMLSLFLGQLGSVLVSAYAKEQRAVSDMTEAKLDEILMSRGTKSMVCFFNSWWRQFNCLGIEY